MATVQNVSLTAPTDYTAEGLSIERRRRLAESLFQQSQEPLQTNQTAGGYVIPVSPFAGLAKALNQGVAGFGMARADRQEKDLAAKYQSSLVDTLTKAQGALTGSPATPAQTGMEPFGAATTEATPAVPGNPSLAASLLMQHPGTQALGLNQVQQQMAIANTAARLKAALGTVGAGGSPDGAQAGPNANPIGGMPPQIVALMTSGDPELVKLGQSLMEANKGIAQRPGAPVVNPWTGAVIAQPAPQMPAGTAVTMGPNGPQGYKVPGAADAMGSTAGQVAGAVEAAKSPYETVPQTMADGRIVQTPKSQVPGIGTPIGAAPSPQPAFGPGVTQAGPNEPVSGPPQTVDQLPLSDQGAARQALAATAAGRPAAIQGGDPWATMPKMAVPQGIGQSTYDKTIATHSGEAASKLSEKYGAVADTSNQRLALISQAQELVDKSDTGPLAAQVSTVKNWLVSNLGVPEDDFKNTPSATIALQKDLVNAATQKAKQQFGSRITQSEVMLMMSRGAPNVDMTKAAIKYLLGTDAATAKYQIQQANDLGKYLQNGGDPMRFEGWYSKAFPLTQAQGDVKLQTGKDATAPSPQAIADEMRRRGLIK